MLSRMSIKTISITMNVSLMLPKTYSSSPKTFTGKRLTMTTNTKKTDIQMALSTASPVGQLRKVVPSS
jgi:hypothetical protein